KGGNGMNDSKEGKSRYRTDLKKICPHGFDNVHNCRQTIRIDNLPPICALQEESGICCPQIIIFALANSPEQKAYR
ncbi:MAG: hypothetical protein ABII10_01175, partial [Candidatus Paceibacterota bacterium]